MTNTVNCIFMQKKRNRNLLNNSGLRFSFFPISGFLHKNALKHARKLRFFCPKRVNFHKKGGVMRYLSIIFLLFAAVFVANAEFTTCHCDCHRSGYDGYCNWCADYHRKDECHCDCHSNRAVTYCADCRQWHEMVERVGLEEAHEDAKYTRRFERSVRPRQKRTTPRQPQHSNGRSATRSPHR